MSIFGFLGKKKKDREEKETASFEMMEAGIEEQIRKRQEEQKEEDKPIVLEDYQPTFPEPEEVNEPEVPSVRERTREECIQFIKDACEQISEVSQYTENAKIEYQAVTDYLSDVQKIERMDKKERQLLNDTATKIERLTKEREEYLKREISTDNPCFRVIRQKEKTILDELKSMREQEEYRKIIQNDLRQLEAEKAALKYDYEHLPQKQQELKKIAIVMAVIVLSLFVLFFVLQEGLEASMTVPFIMTVIMAAGILFYVFWEGYQNRYEHEVLVKKLNRAIQLLNKVKIKYINNTSTLDYSYTKYGIKNSMELEYLIKEYNNAKEAERSYESNTDRLAHYREKVQDILGVHQVQDTEIWLHQLSVLNDELEFAEMKGSLEARRQRLVEKMDYNAQVKDQCFEKMHMVLAERQELREDVMSLMREYNISL